MSELEAFKIILETVQKLPAGDGVRVLETALAFWKHRKDDMSTSDPQTAPDAKDDGK